MSCIVIPTFLAALAARQTDYRGIAVGAVHDGGSMSDRPIRWRGFATTPPQAGNLGTHLSFGRDGRSSDPLEPTVQASAMLGHVVVPAHRQRGRPCPRPRHER